MSRHSRTLLLAAVLCLFTAIAAACGGDDDPATPTATAPAATPTATEAVAPETPTSTSTAAATSTATPTEEVDGPAGVALAALLTTEDLPEAEWLVSDFDGLEGDDEPADPTDDLFGADPACAELAAAIEQFGNDDVDPLADRERQFDTEDETTLAMASVVHTVTLPDPSTDIEGTFATMREVMTVDAMRPCFEAGMTSSLGGDEDVTINAVEVTEPESVVDGGFGVVIRVEATALVFPLEMRIEMHLWPEGPAVGSLIMMEMNSDLVSANRADILDRAQQRLADAVSGME